MTSEINMEIVGKVVEGYKVVKPLGQGKFSTVYHAERLKDNKMVALKIVKIFDMMDNKQREKCLQEVKLLQSVDHPNIIKYLDSFIYENELYIAIEWADRGDLKRYLNKCGKEGEKIDEIKIIDFTRQLASALLHMHEKRIIHRDLKPANILIFGDGTLKLGDLGLGRYMSFETFKAFSKVGTPLYMSPEVIRNDGYDFKSDVWSLGCVIYEIMTFKSPFRTDEKISLIDLFTKINKGDYPKINDDKYKIELKSLVEKMLTVNPDERVSLDDVLKICNDILSNVEDKPKIDPFIVMEDIVEKLRLLNYEKTYCKKYKKEPINRFYFSCNLNRRNELGTNLQFIYFYELSSWLISLIKQNISLNVLNDYDVKARQYDRKRSNEAQLNDLLSDLKYNDIKIIENVKVSSILNGYGEGICLIITQLLDKYLVNQNFDFRAPIFDTSSKKYQEKDDDNFEDPVIHDEFPLGPNGASGDGRCFSLGIVRGDQISEQVQRKRNRKSSKSLAYDYYNEMAEGNKAYLNIIEPNIDPEDWKEEYQSVKKYLDKISSDLKSSGGENDETNVNLNDIFDPKSRLEIISVVSKTLRKANQNPNFNKLNTLSLEVDNSLKNIAMFEKKFSHNAEKKIKNIQGSNSKSSEINESIKKVTENIEKLEDKLSSMEERQLTLKKVFEDKLSNVDLKPKMESVREAIAKLNSEIKKLDVTCGFYQQTIFSVHQSKRNIKGNFENVYEDEFDEYL